MCMVLEQKHNHLINPKHIKQLILGRADCSPFPDGLWLDIITASFIDLDKVFTGCYSLLLDTTFTQTIGDANIVLEASNPLHLPRHIDEFDNYECFIGGQFTMVQPSKHHCVIKLDKALIKQAIEVNNYTFSNVPNFMALCTQFLNPARLRANNPGTRHIGAK
ncbi:hypothetical protein M422DRAFT_250178 [Sphaerobolus stellatus SS14]|uniref:Uncharacterized protein n=1 Tax=Sphaerobolus stellatus (strain SS14) TaxID=990650 RepID=A0A0C9VGI0_SPHS4|nr:hypothetical protein M422DRAFT_250178 [Sphaerobolus stellatus SS14]